MGMGSKLQSWIKEELVDELQRRLESAVEQGIDRHVRLAITGLSRSGKTVFITSLVHHLLEAHHSEALPFFDAASQRRILSIKDLSRHSEQPFPLQQALSSLSAEPPCWPESTTGMSEVRLAIRYRPASRFERILGDSATLYLDIIDYPGEWLLDLPMLNMDFASWCQHQRTLFASEPRKSLAADWIAAQAQIDWQAPADEAALDTLSEQFTALLHQLRTEEYGMSLLQPGRCILPGDLADSPLIRLFPVLIPATPASATQESAYHAMQQRYEAYRNQVVKRFYREHFARFDRQVVLVDCLKTLNQGKACFDDMKQALNEILQSFNYGSSSLLRRMFSPRIDRVLFASSKADHVTANQHHNLDKFLELIIQESRREMRFEEINTQCMAISAIRATESAQAQLDGQTLSCLKGTKKGTNEPVAIFPGEVPIELPTQADWNKERFRFLDFAPKRLPMNNLKPQHHIRMDQALEFLLGDLF